MLLSNLNTTLTVEQASEDALVAIKLQKMRRHIVKSANHGNASTAITLQVECHKFITVKTVRLYIKKKVTQRERRQKADVANLKRRQYNGRGSTW
jgi:hypothetical protein